MNDRGAEDDESRRPSAPGAESGTRADSLELHDDRSAAETESIPVGTPSGSDPESGPASGADRGPNASRNWTGLTAALALVSLLTAVAIVPVHDATMPAIGATVLAGGFAAIAAVSRTNIVDVVGVLAESWAEHRLYVWFATGLFGFGTIVGALLLLVAGVDLTELFLEMLSEEFSEEELAGGIELSATFFITQNTPPFLAAIVGAVTLGLATALIMLFNGVLIGNLVFAVGSEAGIGLIAALIIPHGIFELPSLFIAAGVGFRLLHRIGQRILGSRDTLFTKAYLVRTGGLVLFGWLLLVLAAFIEAYLTLPIAELFFPEQAG